MKKVYKIENLCCADCAAKMQREIEKLDGVNDVKVNFILEKITLDVDDDKMDAAIESMKQICRKIEPDCILK